MNIHLRELPAIHVIQKDQRFIALSTKHNISGQKLTEMAQDVIHDIRQQIIDGNWQKEAMSKADFTNYIFNLLEQQSILSQHYRIRHVINATGTILHTNLGRAKLSEEAIKQVVLTAKHYTNLEYDLEKGKRGSRHSIIESILTEITGAEAAMVVNNNAAAVYLILRALAKGKEVVISRGELVEIGGSFRISSIMEESGAMLREVGTTNKTHLYDYEQAINEQTVMLMKVHTSNFRTVGFTHAVESAELVDLAKQDHRLCVYEDLGSGALHRFEIGNEPVVSDVLKSGVDIVSFSGDKLLGGPQAGIIVGKRNVIEKLKRHQLARVLRVDKMTLAALEATVKSYLKGDVEQIPAIRDISFPLSEIKKRIDTFINGVGHENNDWRLDCKEDTSQIGGGTMPGIEIPTLVCTVGHVQLSTQQIFKRLRTGETAVLARIKNDQVLLDFRTITEEEIPLLIEHFVHM
ncbi:L-seryl-tRNA(Sec) selenium transferase [Lentibacillus sp. N15]|uniref:L-seryl-tRNA(Sec) selenium transferase n=1 Tax=Lentibacillus songyuanensis TaxID=3136161 RepID=UPI0031BBC7E3